MAGSASVHCPPPSPALSADRTPRAQQPTCGKNTIQGGLGGKDERGRHPGWYLGHCATPNCLPVREEDKLFPLLRFLFMQLDAVLL